VFDYRSMFDLSGKTALVDGAGSGIGAASAQGLAAFGARVFCADLSVQSAESTVREVREGGGEGEALELDIRDKGRVQEVAGQIGAPDVLVSTPS
jgi:NAD(P)-dependent dehydrogenase (short-subunit alcohol dehydrogenase family)